MGMTHSRAGLPDFIDDWSKEMDELPPGFLSTKKLPSMKKVLTYPESRKKLLSKEIEELLESKGSMAVFDELMKELRFSPKGEFSSQETDFFNSYGTKMQEQWKHVCKVTTR